jgi:hypothetical protein
MRLLMIVCSGKTCLNTTRRPYRNLEVAACALAYRNA